MNWKDTTPENNKKSPEKNQNESKEEKNFLWGIISEVREVFSDRLNVIIIVGAIVIGWGSIGWVILHEINKPKEKTTKEFAGSIENTQTIETPESIEMRENHERILNNEPITSVTPPLEDKKQKEIKNENPSQEQTNTKSKSERKDMLREEILTKWSATIGTNPEDIKHLPDLINETLNGEKRK